MARQKSGKENIRKLGTTGSQTNQSYFITLPIDLVRKLGWRSGQKLVIRENGAQLIIEDWKE